MNDPSPLPSDSGVYQLSQLDRTDRICDAYERQLQEGLKPRLEDYLADVPTAERANLRLELEALQGDYLVRSKESAIPSESRPIIDLDHPKAARSGKTPPASIGRYRIEKVLGQGGFGLVYLAHDEQLNRLVAVKLPHARLISKPEVVEAYLAEARTVANLDHPGIVPVHDVGSTADCPCYIVSKYIEGTDLATKLKESRLKYREAVELVATVAEALHYAHKQGLVHRDVKPGNILIGKDGQPYVVDFGLALREENLGQGPQYAGTPAYMSPEQARGEGHRVDGRSDIFSLGVVFYELLTGRRPFRGDTQAELFEQVTSYEALPVRQYDEKLPQELARICHKAMAKRAYERYTSAHDLAEDLRLFLQEQRLLQNGTSPGGVASAVSATQASKQTSKSLGSTATSSALIDSGSSDSQPIKIVPKGLRSFDVHDADFFLELLPGPRDRDGLPDSLRFWKTAVAESLHLASARRTLIVAMNDVTQILERMESGDPSAAERLLPVVYGELRKLATAKLAHEKPGQTLQATALVHEAYLRLVAAEQAQHWESRGHFFAAAAESMRRILVESARRKKRLKRGGGLTRRELNEASIAAAGVHEDLLELDAALDRLQAVDPQALKLVHLRYFVGLSIPQAAELLGISPRTADRLWAFARAWLHREIGGKEGTQENFE